MSLFTMDIFWGKSFSPARLALPFGTLLLASTVLSEPVLAQDVRPTDAAIPSSTGGDLIIVTARRRDENLQSVPVSITAVGAETLEDFRIQNLDNLQSMDPSFSVSASSGRPNSPVYSLRGIRPTEAIYGQDPTVAIYLADVVLSPAQGSNLGFYDLANVQILKGPQGTLFGRNTVGGAVLLTPRKPGDELAVNGMVGLGSYGLFETELGVDIPLADTLRLRVAGRTIDGGNYQTNVAPGPNFGMKLGGQESRSVRATLVGELSPAVTNTIIGMYDRNFTPGRGSTLQAVNPAHSVATLYPGILAALVRAQNRPNTDIESDLVQRDNVEAWGVINTFEAEISDDVTVKLIGAYREVDTNIVFDLDATSIPQILTSEQRASLNHGSVEAQILGTSFDGRLDWVAGLYYYAESGFENSPGAFFGRLIQQNGTVANESYSAFAQGSFKLTPDLNITAGGRLNRDKKGLTISQTLNNALCLLQVDNGSGGLARLPLSECEVDLSESFSQPTGTLSADYQISPNTLIYLAGRLGYRSGGFNLRASQPVQYEPFQQETVMDIEFGAKSDWNVGTVEMRTNLAVFYQKYDDIQRTVAVVNSVGAPASAVINAAAANVFGIELQQTIRPIDNLTLRLNYAFNKPKYESWVDPATGGDLSSTPFYFTPEHSGNAMVTYEQPLGGNMGELKFGFNAAYTGDIWISALQTSASIAQHPEAIRPLLRQESYWLLDANVGWQNIMNSNLDLLLYVKNMTDAEYKIGGLQLYTGASGFIGAAFGQPRTFGAQLRFEY